MEAARRNGDLVGMARLYAAGKVIALATGTVVVPGRPRAGMAQVLVDSGYYGGERCYLGDEFIARGQSNGIGWLLPRAARLGIGAPGMDTLCLRSFDRTVRSFGSGEPDIRALL
jgi:hypothetical protein